MTLMKKDPSKPYFFENLDDLKIDLDIKEGGGQYGNRGNRRVGHVTYAQDLRETAGGVVSPTPSSEGIQDDAGDWQGRDRPYGAYPGVSEQAEGAMAEALLIGNGGVVHGRGNDGRGSGNSSTAAQQDENAAGASR